MEEAVHEDLYFGTDQDRSDMKPDEPKTDPLEKVLSVICTVCYAFVKSIDYGTHRL